MKIGIATALTLSLLALSACGDLLDPAAAVVRGDKITIDEVQTVVDRFTVSEAYAEARERGEGATAKRQFERTYLAQLVRRAVLGPEAERLGIAITDEDVDREIDRIKADFPNPAAYREALREQGLTPDLLRSLVADSLLEEALRAEVTKDAGPNEQELIDYYDANIEDYRERRASHILVGRQQRAEDIHARLELALPERVDDLFVELAARYSIDEQSAEQGGDLGWFAEGAFVPEFERAVARLRVDEVSRPVETEFGWHIILLTGERTKSFAAVRDELETEVGDPIRDEAWLQWLEETYAEADVEINPRYGVFDVETQSILDPDEEDIPGAAEPSEEPATRLPDPEG